MELTEAMKRLEIFAGQQMNDEMETAIRTVLAEMKQKKDADMVRCCGETHFCKSARDVAEVVTCADCKLNMTENCSMYWGYIDAYGEKSGQRWNKEDDFCSWGERK